MLISYDKLWKKLNDNRMNKLQLKGTSGISFNVLVELKEKEFGTMESSNKI